MLRGQYSHNNGIFTNGLPGGGFDKAYTTGIERSTIATWLRDAGYKTVLLGKYLNGYPNSASGQNYIPPGWTEWFGLVGGPRNSFDYTLNENGTIVHYGTAIDDYLQDVLNRKTADFIRRNAASENRKPFLVWLATSSPHLPATPAPRHANNFLNAIAPRTPTFNEADVSRQPAWIRNRARLTSSQIAEIDTLYRLRLRSMLAVVDTVTNIIRVLGETGDLANTYIFFTSDNGFRMGQHRLMPGKGRTIEEDIRIPLIVRGPGVPAGVVRSHLAVNIDLTATFADIVGVAMPVFVDGRSLVPLLNAAAPAPSAWRKSFLMERGFSNGHAAESGVRTRRYSYTKLLDGTSALYDLFNDPFEHVDIANTARQSLLDQLEARRLALINCSGQSCRNAENQPIP
jgi:arylsulfatase A-like enzyme